MQDGRDEGEAAVVARHRRLEWREEEASGAEEGEEASDVGGTGAQDGGSTTAR